MKKLIFFVFILISSVYAGEKEKFLTPKQVKESNEKITGLFYGEDIDGDELYLDSPVFTSRSNYFHSDNYYFSFELDKYGKIIGLERPLGITGTIVKYKRDGDSNSFIRYYSYVKFEPSESDIKLLKLEDTIDLNRNGNLSEKENNRALLKMIKRLLKTDVSVLKNIKQSEKEEAYNKINKLRLDSKGIEVIYVKSIITLEMYGKDLGLKYSDFGILKERLEEKSSKGNLKKINSPSEQISGGYRERKIYTGYNKKNTYIRTKTVGIVEKIKNPKQVNYLDLVDNKSVLIFDSKYNPTLKMSFDNWYNIDFTSDEDSTFFINENNNDINEALILINGSFLMNNGIDIECYGINKEISEVVGNLDYRIDG